MTVRPASFFGVTTTSVMVGSDTEISAPSDVQAAVGSADTMGTRKSWEVVGDDGRHLRSHGLLHQRSDNERPDFLGGEDRRAASGS